MFDIGWTEMAVIALVLLIVIGPKELPTMLRTVGRYVRKARMLTRDFQHSLEDMAREAELDEAKKTIQSASSMNLERSFEEAVDPEGDVKAEARALDATARDTSLGGTATPSEENATAKPSSSGTAPTNGAAKAEPETASQPAEAAPERAEHRVQPANPAPAHSVTPPEEAPVTSKTSAG